ncbi:hypothetical protein [Pseudomonas fluorescens]|uniref:hypothetical protein n=1 Tax=Pseudomonas fluorescens TaxID=294 RepID=UPI00124096FE|nr:hypothetical protein [Pseudomonas fluorescens]
MTEVEYPGEKAAIIAVMIDSLTQVRQALCGWFCRAALLSRFLPVQLLNRHGFGLGGSASAVI